MGVILLLCVVALAWLWWLGMPFALALALVTPVAAAFLLIVELPLLFWSYAMARAGRRTCGLQYTLQQWRQRLASDGSPEPAAGSVISVCLLLVAVVCMYALRPSIALWYEEPWTKSSVAGTGMSLSVPAVEPRLITWC